MQRNIAEVANETRAVEGTSFWNIVRHSFRTCCVSSLSSYKDLCCVKHNQLICDVRRQKVHSKFFPYSFLAIATNIYAIAPSLRLTVFYAITIK